MARWSVWRALESRPPVDWEYFASQRRRNVAGEPQPAWWHVKRFQVWRANRRAAYEARASDSRARQLTAWHVKLTPKNLTLRLLVAMEPGKWYGRPDLRNATGIDYGSVKARTAVLVRRGVLEKAEDPDWRPVEYRKGEPAHLQARKEGPRFLFRMTARGEAMRAAALEQHAAEPSQKRKRHEPAYCE